MRFTFTFVAAAALASLVAAKTVTFQYCNTCTPSGTGFPQCDQVVYGQDDGQNCCDAPPLGSECDGSWEKGQSCAVTTHGEDCTFFDDANWDDIDVGAGIGHMDCPSQGNIRCNKGDSSSNSCTCGLTSACQNVVVCEW